MFDPNDIDLRRVVRELVDTFAGDPPVGYLRGRTAFRDALADRLGCSALEAEELVDTLEARGFLRYTGDPSQRSLATGTWSVGSL